VYLLLCAIVFSEPDVSLKDLERFPSESEVMKVFLPVKAQGEWIEKLLRSQRKNPNLFHPSNKENLQRIDGWVRWHSQNFEPWVWLGMAHGHCDDLGQVRPHHRLRALRELRKLIGPEAYRKGKVPLPNLLQ
jgi:hypothetical protein